MHADVDRAAVKALRERRDLFDEHCKHKVRENRLKKAAAGQQKADVRISLSSARVFSILVTDSSLPPIYSRPPHIAPS